MSGTAVRSREQDSQLTIIEGLARSRMCAGLIHTDIIALARHAELRHYRPLGEAASEGQLWSHLEIVLQGRFIVLLPSARLEGRGEGAMVDLDVYVPGDCFGDAGLVSDSAAPASIIASERSLTVRLPVTEAIRVLQQRPEVGLQVYRNLLRMHIEQQTKSPAVAAGSSSEVSSPGYALSR